MSKSQCVCSYTQPEMGPSKFKNRMILRTDVPGLSSKYSTLIIHLFVRSFIGCLLTSVSNSVLLSIPKDLLTIISCLLSMCVHICMFPRLVLSLVTEFPLLQLHVSGIISLLRTEVSPTWHLSKKVLKLSSFLCSCIFKSQTTWNW